VFALFWTLPAVLLNKYPSDTNSVAQSESTGEHNGLTVDGGRGFPDVVVGTFVVVIGTFVVVIGTFVVIIGFSVGGFTGSVNEAHSILSPTKSAY
jgi:hypothetical protein